MSEIDAGRLFGLALDTLRSWPFGFLITVSGGRAHTRLVQHLAVQDDGTVWLGTSPRSRKAAELARDPSVLYAVENRDAFAYTAVRARAALVDDPAERAARWVDSLAEFFPGGPTGDDFVLVALTPDRIELMDFAHQVHPDPYGLVPAVIERGSGGGWEPGTAERTR